MQELQIAWFSLPRIFRLLPLHRLGFAYVVGEPCERLQGIGSIRALAPRRPAWSRSASAKAMC